MRSLLGQQLLTFDEAAKLIPGRPHKNTVRRWADIGVDGERLQSWRVGCKRVTSIEAIERFILARSGQQQCVTAQSASEAEAKLDALGVY